MTADELVPRKRAISELRVSDATFRRLVNDGWLHVVKRGRSSFVYRADLVLLTLYGRTGKHPPADVLQRVVGQHMRERRARILADAEALRFDWFPPGGPYSDVELWIAYIREAERRLSLEE